MRKRSLLCVFLATALALSACSSGSDTSPAGEPVAYNPGDATQAEARVRAALPAIEAYWSEKGTYRGVTLAALRRYDTAIRGIRFVKPLNKRTYCIESRVGAVTYYYRPGDRVAEGTCADPAQSPPPPQRNAPPQYDPETNIRAAIPAIEAYYADHNTYAGVTDDLLRAKYDFGLPRFAVVRATSKTYCIQSTVNGVSFHKAGPAADIAPGAC
jgi:hypothetical protein